MPHCVVEYSTNLEEKIDIDGLLEKLAAHFRSAPEYFPPAGLRVRAWPVSRYVVADGDRAHGFVNITYRIAEGRPEAFRKVFFAAAFDLVMDHLAPTLQSTGIGVTLYVDIPDPVGAFKANNISKFLKG